MKRLLSLSACLLFSLGAVACGSDDTDEPATPAAEETTEHTTNAVDIAMLEYGFQVTGQAYAGPLKLNFSNTGEQIHHGIVGKIDEGKTIEDVAEAVKQDEGPPPPWFDDSPFDLQVISPGQTSGLWIDAEPGNYALLCFMPDPKGKPHALSGMYTILEVTEGPEMDMEAPAPDAEIAFSEDGAVVPDLQAGESVLAVTNDGKDDGEFTIIQIAEGKKLRDIDKWFGSGMQGPAPVTFFGGTHTYKPGETVTLAVNLPAGDYTFLSGFGDGKDAKEIETEFTAS